MRNFSTKILFKDANVLVSGEYSPAEPMVMYYHDGSGYPGCSEDMNITSVRCADPGLLKGVEIIDKLSDEDFSEIEDLVYDAWMEQADWSADY